MTQNFPKPLMLKVLKSNHRPSSVYATLNEITYLFSDEHPKPEPGVEVEAIIIGALFRKNSANESLLLAAPSQFLVRPKLATDMMIEYGRFADNDEGYAVAPVLSDLPQHLSLTHVGPGRLRPLLYPPSYAELNTLESNFGYLDSRILTDKVTSIRLAGVQSILNSAFVHTEDYADMRSVLLEARDLECHASA